MKIHGGAPNPTAALNLDVALADYAISHGGGFNIPSCPKLARVLQCAKYVPNNYKPPGPNKVGGELLKKLYDINWNKAAKSLKTDSHIYGISLFGDRATILNAPLVNVLGAGVHCPSAVLDIANCTDHCALVKKKDA